jgi:hypothetical protein
MKKLCESALEIGDIILTTTNAPVSKAIRTYTKSEISHAMIYVDDYSVIDATDEGVHARNTQRIFFDDNCPIHVLRLTTPLHQSEMKAVCNFVRSRVGTEYSTREAVLTAVGGGKSSTRKQFCSRLVAQAYGSVGHLLVPDPNFCSPEELKSSPLIAEVTGATQPASDEEVRQSESHLDMTKIMRDVTNRVLKGARGKNKDIQDFNDIVQHLITHPAEDAFFCDLLTASGYLTQWRAEMDQNPWQYDVALMRSKGWPQAGIEDYCSTVLSTAANGGERFHLNKVGYLKLWSDHKLDTFLLLSSLYETLSDLDMCRYQVAKEWLNALKPQAEIPDPYLTPHSPEWFVALRDWNPYQADATRVIVELTGKLDVCSICGDEPASDYKLDEETPPLGSVRSLRLCDGCLRIREGAGESFVPLRA